MPASLYLDDDVTPALARLLLARGIDAITTADAGTLGSADEVHLEFAARAGRVLLSCNYHDFLPLAEQWFVIGREHQGVILSFHQYSQDQIHVALQRTLRLLAAVPAEELRNTVRFLDEFRDSGD